MLAELHGQRPGAGLAPSNSGQPPRRSPSASWRSRRDGVAEPQPLGAQPQAGRRPRRMACSAASGGSDAAGAAAAWSAARFAVRRCGAHSPSRQRRQVGAAPWTTLTIMSVSCLLGSVLAHFYTPLQVTPTHTVSSRISYLFRLHAAASSAAERMALKMSSSKVATRGGGPRGTAGVGGGGALGVRPAQAADWMADRMSAGGGMREIS